MGFFVKKTLVPHTINTLFGPQVADHFVDCMSLPTSPNGADYNAFGP